MKRLLFTLELTTTMAFIVVAFLLGVWAGWQSAGDSGVSERETQTLQKVGE